MIETSIEVIDESKQVKTKTVESLEDMNGHGTHVTGIIVKGLKKSHTKFKVIPFKNIDGEYSEETKKNLKEDMGIEEIVDFAIENKIKILNISQTYPFYNETVFNALKKAGDNGILIIAAAGNQKINLSTMEKVYLMKKETKTDENKPQANSFPCAYKLDNIICVGNYLKVGSKNIIRVPESNFGETMIDVMSYGQDVESSCLMHSKCKMSGSSMSTPRVTVEVAKIWTKNPKMSAVEVKAKLIKSLPKDKKLMSLTKNGSVLD